MKFTFMLLFISIFIFSSCSKKDENKLVLSNHDAYAFSVDNGWEVTTSVMVKGFKHETSKNGKNYASLSYSVDLVKTNGDTVKSVSSDKVEEEKSEELSDLKVEAQVELDSTYTPGKYKVIFNIKDNLSNSRIRSAEDLDLE